ncbi:uncharacterized protein LOC112519400 [Cynara cardunculus var. scolymus]|uniref:Wall-associated receptor kinase galacturonan-binding domain-containing protein n=1 Tax=Cynara cardunculus var. scolymus TaxID=59895 RepID=A0A103XZI6_CYNCS|nr:uncharacterized protein LOC112519400 [Cynara cardunculus var. scolymus]KVH99773.1 Wall-associated receptor kinase galacturonan-binding domain-containing protein [Cynara cardunculus var. scolymus]
MYPLLLLPFLLLFPLGCFPVSLPLCRNSCGRIHIDYPFAIDDGCGSPLYRNMFNCSTTFASTSNTSTSTSTATATATATDLFFQTPSGSYKVETIDYASKSLTIYDPSMSTCTILQPHHDFLMSDLQFAIIPPSPDTIFALLNCSLDSPILNHYKSLCFDNYHSCDDLYASCTSFKIFQMLSNNTPPCCFTSYTTLKFMSINILDCTHYTSFYDADKLNKPLDWSYGIKLSYGLADTGCDGCRRSGGTCGFDVETQGLLCICSPTLNSTRECGAGTTDAGGRGGDGKRLVVPFLRLITTIAIATAFALL